VVEQVVDPGGANLNLRTQTTHDGLGNRKAVRDPRGRTTLFQHDGLGRLVRTEDAAGKESRAAYDGEGLRTSETDRRGVEKRFTYDNLRRPRRTDLVPRGEMSGVSWSQETRYLDRDRQRVEIDARGKQTVLDLDGLDRVVKLTDPRGKTSLTRWDGVNKRAETDKRGHTTLFQYDRINRLTLTRDPEPFQQQTLETTYADAENKRTDKDRRNIVTVTQMDPLGRRRTVTRAGVALETHTYDPLGNRLTSEDAENKETRFVYDPANRLESRTDGFGTAEVAKTEFEYDENGNQTRELDKRAADLGRPYSISRTYDDLNRLETQTDGEGHTTRYAYDFEGNRTRLEEPLGQTTRFEYDELGKLTRVLQPIPREGQPTPVTSYVYDESRNRTHQTDANEHVVQMDYDSLNRLETMTQDPGGLGLLTRYEYDDNGNQTVLHDPKGQTVTSEYDELNRLKSVSYAFAAGDSYRPWRHLTSKSYVYDGNANIREITEFVASGNDPPESQVTLRDYDDFDRLSSETSPLPDGGTRTVGYTYWLNGARKTLTDPAGEVTSYTYDGQNRLDTATTAAGVTEYTYWPDDLLRTVTTPNGVVATHGYDLADRLLSITNAHGPTPISSYGYGYDANGNRLSQTEVNGGLTESTSYTYDGLNRLETVRYPADATFPSGRVVTYGYDSVGNRTGETVRAPDGALLAEKQGVFDNVNRLTALNDLVDPAQSVAFAYDPNGNQTRKTVGSTVTDFRYDIRDRLVEVGQGESILSRFQYDCDGRRTKKIGEDGIRQYVYDQTSLLLEYDENGLQKAKYDYGSDRLLSLTRADEGRRFFAFDGLRSVTNLTDDAGSTVANYHLDAWGNFRFPSELLASKNRFAFTGYIWDKETSLFFAKSRFYDPLVGRFTSADSYLGQIDDPPSLHRYFYANANPLRYIDPTGHQNAPANPTVTPEQIRQWEEYGKLHPVETRTTDHHGPNQVPEGTVHEEGFFAGLGRWYREKRDGGKRWVREHTGALGRKLFNPETKPERDEHIRQAFADTHSAEGAAHDLNERRKVGEGVQQVSGELGTKGGDLLAEGAFQAAETYGGGKLAGVALGGASRGARMLRNAAKSSDDVIDAAALESRQATQVQRFAGGTSEPITDPSRLLTAGGETTRTREQVARLRGTGRERGAAFDQYLAETHGGTRGNRIDTPLGARVHDVGGVPTGTATEMAIEGKNYLRYRSVGGQAVKGRVPLTPQIEQQIYKDVLWIREGRKAGVDRLVQWEFAGAGPSPELAKALERWGLPYVQ
jgi:RHS repeat-associated protein